MADLLRDEAASWYAAGAASDLAEVEVAETLREFDLNRADRELARKPNKRGPLPPSVPFAELIGPVAVERVEAVATDGV